MDNFQCSICLEEFAEESTITMKSKCGHWTFHNICLDEWFNSSGSKRCPICKEECPKENKIEMAASMAKKLQTHFWNKWRNLQMCCSEHILKSSGLIDLFNEKYEKYQTIFTKYMNSNKTLKFCRTKNNTLFVCRISVTGGNKKPKIICKEFFAKPYNNFTIVFF